MNVKIRKANSGDWQDIRALIRMFPKQLMQSNLPKARSFFVAVHVGKIVGCCAMQLHSGRLGEVRDLAVHPDFQGKGIGKKLVLTCVARAKKEGVKWLLSITGAKAVFEKMGFGSWQREKYAMLMALPGKKAK